MNCPNCGHIIDYGSKCPRCKLDAVLFSATLRLSDVLYNRGLACAKAGNLSGAIENLTKSIHINKNNIFARNLLGLALYEIGRVGDALKEWVISQSLMMERNPAARYLDDANKSGRVLEMYDDAVRMYNKALEYLRQQSDDMALIQLKKAVEYNPRFIDALNLLTLCYLIQGDRERASMTVERVFATDPNNVIALNYYNELNPVVTRPENHPRKAQPPKTGYSEHHAPPPPPVMHNYPRIPVNDRRRSNFHLTEILSFIVGAACMFAALYVLVIPAVTRGNEAEVNDYRTRLETSRQEYRAELNEKNDLISELQDELDQYYEDGAGSGASIDRMEREIQILTAYILFGEQQYQEAFDIASEVRPDGFSYDLVTKRMIILDETPVKLAQSYFNDGYNAFYHEDDRAKALASFEKSYFYSSAESPHYADLLYFLGIIYFEDANGARAALDILGRLAEVFPEYEKINEVNALISSLTGE